MSKTGISSRWAEVARGCLGNSEGIHCHWCVHAKFDEGEVTCGNEKSKFCDDDRIRTWDGEYCAKECGLFELSEWYKDDKNFESYFNEGE